MKLYLYLADEKIKVIQSPQVFFCLFVASILYFQTVYPRIQVVDVIHLLILPYKSDQLLFLSLTL